MRTIFLGTSDFAAGILSRLTGSAHAPKLVLTRQSKPQGRGRRLAAPPVAIRAEQLGLPLMQPASVNGEEALSAIEAANPDAIVVCAFGALVKEPLLSLSSIFNIHPSLLPRWRGAAPIERAMIAGDECTGVSIMRLTAGLDSGPVCMSRAVPIGAEDDYRSLSERLCAIGGQLIVEALDAIAGGAQLDWVEQCEANATYAAKILPADRVLTADLDAPQLERIVRALRPHIGARIVREGCEPLGVWRAEAVGDGPPEGALQALDGNLLYGCRSGALKLLEVQPPGKRAMPAEAYLRGHAV